MSDLAEKFADAECTAKMELVKLYTQRGKHWDVLEICDDLLAKGCSDELLLRSAAQSLIAAILESPVIGSRLSERCNTIVKSLILQTGHFGGVRALHYQVAGSRLPGRNSPLAIIAKEFTPVLSALWKEGCREKNLLLMILLLRDHVNQWLDQGTISRWHLDQLPGFTLDDMTIPYNMMFDRKTFARNVEDIRLLTDSLPLSEIAIRYGAWKLILFQFITKTV